MSFNMLLVYKVKQFHYYSTAYFKHNLCEETVTFASNNISNVSPPLVWLLGDHNQFLHSA